MLFKDKKILVGICGGIASYKSCELIRELRRRNAQVRVMMTPRAGDFINPLVFAALSENSVLTDLFPQHGSGEINHIDWSQWADVIVICPATANSIARLACGFSDEPVSATVRAAKVPVILCPAMNSGMWENVIQQKNISTLRTHDYRFVEPEFGAFASSSEGDGWGRLAKPEWILTEILTALQPQAPLAGKKVLITAGRTEEYLDPVRMLTNPSSGKMGFAIAEAAIVLGAEVILVHGPTELISPYKAKTIPVTSALEMKEAVFTNYTDIDILIMAAAVCDYRPQQISKEKIKKINSQLSIELEKTDDILALLGLQKSNAIHIGFAMETEDEINNALLKLRKKNLDLIVLNNPKQTAVGFKSETNKVTIIDKTETEDNLPLLPKLDVAFKIFDKILALF